MKLHKLITCQLISLFVFNSSIAATRTWNGSGGNNNWTNAANWGGTAPSAGDDLIFSGTINTTTNNDFAANTTFNSITFAAGAGNFTLGGAAITLTGGATAIAANNTTNTMTIGLNITFSTIAPTISTAFGGTLAISGAINNGGFLLTNASAGTSIFSGAISGTGALTKSGSGILTLSGANTFAGGVNLNAGLLNINHPTALGTGTFVIGNGTTIDNTTGSTITMSANNTMTWNGDFIFTGTQSLNLGMGTVDMGASVRNITTTANTLSATGIILGSGGITKNGIGTLAFTTSITTTPNWSGINTINAGTVLLGFPNSDNYKASQWIINNGGTLKYATADNILVNSTIVTVNAGGIYDLNSHKDAIGYISGAGNVNNFGSSPAGNGFEIDLPTVGSGSVFSGVISGPGTVNVRGQQGSGKQIFSGLNVYTGPTWIQKGTLSVNTIFNVGAPASALGAPTTVLNGTIQMGSAGNTGILEYTGTTQTTDRVINLVGSATIDQSGPSGSVLSFSSPITANGAGAKTFTLQGSTASTGIIPVVIPDGSGVTSLVKDGTSTWTISGANTYTGTTTARNGRLTLGASGVIPDASNFIADGGTLATAGFSETAGSLTVTNNSTIALGAGVHSLHFAASNGTTWTSAKVLTITGWSGSYNCSSGTSGQIFTGNSAELSAAKLSQIAFINPSNGLLYGACQLGTGEIVPSTIVLPVTLISFTGKKVYTTNELYWSTTNELNSAYFEILRSSDGVHFESIGKIKASGNNLSQITHTFVDNAPVSGTNYYKLVAYDIDGASQGFNTILINNSSEPLFSILSLYPNPASSTVSIRFQAETEGAFTLKLYNNLGQELYSDSVMVSSGMNQYSILLEKYSNGHYFIKISSLEGDAVIKQLVLQD